MLAVVEFLLVFVNYRPLSTSATKLLKYIALYEWKTQRSKFRGINIKKANLFIHNRLDGGCTTDITKISGIGKANISNARKE